MKLILNPAVQFSAFHDATDESLWLCTMPTTNDKEYRTTIPTVVYQFLCFFREGSLLDDVFESSPELDKSMFKALVDDFLLPRGILLSAKNNYQIPDFHKEKPAHMQVQIPVIKASAVNVLSRVLYHLYIPALAVIVLMLGVLSQVYFYTVPEHHVYSMWELSSQQQVLIILAVGGGLLFHELGHASAAYLYGCRKVELGVGWYICFLVFYAELSESWNLSRKQRVIIDSGGMYFQVLYTMILIIIQGYTQSAVLFYAIIMLNVSFIWNLNPFFRMDGYWIASDMLGIANLRAVATTELYRLVAKLFGQTVADSRIAKLNVKARRNLLFYTVISNIFFAYMIYYIGQRLFYSVQIELPRRWHEFDINIFFNQPMLDIFIALMGNIFQIILLLFFSIFLYRVFKSVWFWTVKIKHFLIMESPTNKV